MNVATSELVTAEDDRLSIYGSYIHWLVVQPHRLCPFLHITSQGVQRLFVLTEGNEIVGKVHHLDTVAVFLFRLADDDRHIEIGDKVTEWITNGEPLLVEDAGYNMPKWRMILYLALFMLSIAIVFRGIPYFIGLTVIFTVLLIVDRRALLNVDYGLLLTFVFFFIFAGNMGRIDVVRDFFSSLLDKNTLVVSALCCQFISNVPSAILLSQFTTEYKDLLLGVNIGGVGTLIASLASLITLREYSKNNPGKTKKYILMFTVFNFGFLAVLTGFQYIIK